MKDRTINTLRKNKRQRRAISSFTSNNENNFNALEDERSKSKNSVKCYHRKTTSSYFYGSYLSSNLEDDLLNNLNIDEINNKYNIHESSYKRMVRNSCNIYDKGNNVLEQFSNSSFHSFECDNNNNVNNNNNINNNNNNESEIKQDMNAQKDNEFIIIKELVDTKNENDKNKKNKEVEKNYNNSEKGFFPLKNNLKYIKDKDERATNSYLLALGLTSKQNKKEDKEQYLPTSSIIEEEKSDLIESRSEFSNKKNVLKDKKNFEIKTSTLGRKGTRQVLKFDEKDRKKTLSNDKEKEQLNLKVSVTLNEIISKNNIKRENKRKYLKKNKAIILNSFFNTTEKNNKLENRIEITDKNNLYIKKTDNNNDKEKLNMRFTYFEKKKN